MRKVPVLLPAIDAPHPAKHASVFNTIDGLGLRIGAKESIIFALLSFESIINLSEFPLLIFNVQFPCGTAMKLLENFPSSCQTFLILTWGLDNISSQSNKIFCFFTRVRVNVIFVESIIKPKYSISWHGNNMDFDG